MLTVTLSVSPSQVILKRDCAVMVRDALLESAEEEKLGPVTLQEDTSIPCQEICDCEPDRTRAGFAEISTEGTVICIESVSMSEPPGPVHVIWIVLLPGERMLFMFAKLPDVFEIPSGAGELQEVASVDE